MCHKIFHLLWYSQIRNVVECDTDHTKSLRRHVARCSSFYKKVFYQKVKSPLVYFIMKTNFFPSRLSNQ